MQMQWDLKRLFRSSVQKRTDRKFSRDLAAVIEITILEATEIAVLVKGKAWVEVLKIAVVTEVDRGAGWRR